MLFGRRKIRKDVGELTLSDLSVAPVWEYCLDEEGVEGQAECTVRPVYKCSEVDPGTFDGVVALDLLGPTGARYCGLMAGNAPEFRGSWLAAPVILLDRPVGAHVDHPILHRYNPMMSAASPRVRFSLPWTAHLSEADARVVMDLTYAVLGRGPRELFPLVCRPRVPLKNWPESFTLEGFARPVDRGGEVFESVR